MDPKALSTLDPKLRETYERVMGAGAASPSPTSPAAPMKDAAPEQQSSSTSNFSSDTPATFSSSPTSNFGASQASEPDAAKAKSDAAQAAFNAVTPVVPTEAPPPVNVIQPMMQPLPSPASVAQSAQNNETSPLLRILYIVGTIIFFAIYTVFWIKVFKLPFLF